MLGDLEGNMACVSDEPHARVVALKSKLRHAALNDTACSARRGAARANPPPPLRSHRADWAVQLPSRDFVNATLSCRGRSPPSSRKADLLPLPQVSHPIPSCDSGGRVDSGDAESARGASAAGQVETFRRRHCCWFSPGLVRRDRNRDQNRLQPTRVPYQQHRLHGHALEPHKGPKGGTQQIRGQNA